MTFPHEILEPLSAIWWQTIVWLTVIIGGILFVAKKLNIKYVYINEKEKLLRIKYLCNRLGISLDEVAYIGDDFNDLDVLTSVGMSAMPINSPILDKYTPNYITKRSGGDGAFREFVDLILKHR